VWDGSIASSFAGGTGTEEDPFLISNGSELAYIDTYFLYNSSTPKKYFKLIHNIFLNKNSNECAT